LAKTRPVLIKAHVIYALNAFMIAKYSAINIKQNIIEQEIICNLYHAHIKRADMAMDTCKRPIM